MQCTKCKTDIPASARFCPNCGVERFSDADAKDAKDVTLEWLETVCKDLEYETEIKEGVIVAKHRSYPYMFMEIKAGRFLGINSSWNMKKPPNMFNKATFFGSA